MGAVHTGAPAFFLARRRALRQTTALLQLRALPIRRVALSCVANGKGLKTVT